MTPHSPPPKPKIAIYWCASCGGCDEAILDMDRLLDLVSAVDITLWPVALDFKYDDLRALDDGELALALINGAIRTSEQEAMAQLLRTKARVVVALGACAAWGGVPALANLTSKRAIFDRAYLSAPTLDNPDGTLPQKQSVVAGHPLELPSFAETVRCLADVVDVNYTIPGCPPAPHTIERALFALLGDDPPPQGSVLAEARSLCATCDRKASRPQEVSLGGLHRVVDGQPIDDTTCLLAQGYICLGPATRGGCGQSCINANMPCTGCYGPVEARLDQGAQMLGALGGLLQSEDALAKGRAALVDPAGTFYRYTLATSLLGGARDEDLP